MKKTILLFLFLAVSFGIATAQQKSPVLFDYGKKSVTTAEFMRMYTKNLNNKKADFSKKALTEYLDLYSLFKMKVADAEEALLDTLPTIQKEIASYRKQLSNQYLTNREVTEDLVKEAYNRKKKDVEVAHIMISVSPNSTDTMKQRKLIDSLYKQITRGKLSFEKAAKNYSADKQSAENGGYIGYITGLQVVYPFETAAFVTPKGKVSKPIKTVYGYHLVKKINERPARGEIQVAQIMTLVRKSDGEAGRLKARAKIDSAYMELKSGAEFDDVVYRYNEDQFSKNTGGVLPVFGVGKMVAQYEDAAFALKKRGDFSEVVETENGFHIIFFMKRIPMKSFEDEKRVLQKQVERDGRIKIAQEQFLIELKQRLNYKPNASALTALINAIPDSTLRNGSFDPMDYSRMTKPLFTMDETASLNQADFANYIKKYTRGRIYGDKKSSISSLFDNYVQKVLLDYEEAQMRESNPEYRNLLQEYREGILIFELTDQKVWGKAPRDSVGLQKYFDQNRSKYVWAPAVSGQLYRAKNEASVLKVVKELNKRSKLNPSEIVKNANGDGPQDKVSVEEGKFEQKKFTFNKAFKAGKYMPYYKNKDGSYSLLVVDKVFNSPTRKTLDEARGYVISDYQDQLEKEWHSQLRAKYPVKVNQKVFNSLVK